MTEPTREAGASVDLWCMEIVGPDEVHAAPDFWTALAWSAEHNLAVAKHAISGNWAADENYPHTQAIVAKWPWSPEDHAADLTKQLAERAAHEERRKAAAALAHPALVVPEEVRQPRPRQPWERNYSGNRVGVQHQEGWTILRVETGGADVTARLQPHDTPMPADRTALRQAILAVIPANVPLRGRYATAIMRDAVGLELDRLEARIRALEGVLDQAWRRVVAYRSSQICKRLIASNMLSDMAALGFEVPYALAEAVVRADDETALAWPLLTGRATSPTPDAHARVLAALDAAIRMDATLLMAGEMTAQERRTARAVARGIAAKIRAAPEPDGVTLA